MIKMDMSVVSTVFLALLFVNTVAAFITVFRKPALTTSPARVTTRVQRYII